MKITPVASPALVQTATTSNNTEARTRAISMLEQTAAPTQTAQEHPVADPSNVSPEEMSAIKAPTQAAEAVDESTSTEAAQPTKIEEPPQKDPALEKQFQELAKQERILRAKAQKQAQELNVQKQALEAQKAALDARNKEYEQGYISRDKLKSDPLSVLAEAGLSYDELTQQLLNQQPRDPRVDAELSSLKAEIKALRAANEEGQKSAQQRDADAYNQALRQIEQDTLALVKNDPQAYEAIAKTKSHKDVVELIEQTYAKDGRLMSVEEAAQEVEDYLVEEGINTLSRIDKIKRRLMESNANVAKTPPATQKTQAKQEQTQPQMKTLTNATASTRKLSAKERAMLAFKGELKG